MHDMYNDTHATSVHIFRTSNLDLSGKV
jgi:hypothetical protein